MKKYIILILILAFSKLVSSQDKERAMSLEHHGKYPEAKQIYEQLAESYFINKSYVEYAYANLGIVSCEIGIGHLDAAVIRAKNTLTFVLDNFPDHSVLLSASYMGLGNAYLNTGRNDIALEYLLEGEKLVTESSLQAAECYENIGVAYSNYGNKELALDYHTKAYRIRKEQDSNEVLIGDSHLNIGLVYLIEEPRQSLIYFHNYPCSSY